jgi:poly(3-hydroxybutyrate) depolymerase/regulation of enolase protein 1 (concanavalin A-like superfamily)
MKTLRLVSVFFSFALFPIACVVVGAQAANPWPEADYLSRQFHGVNYRLWPPKMSSPADSATKYPLLIILHGNGLLDSTYEAGNPLVGNSKQMTDMGQFTFVTPQSQATFPCFLVLPQRGTTQGGHAAPDFPTAIKDLVGALETEFPIDPDRVIISGASGGGGHTLDCASAFPERYAAAIPLAPINGGDAARLTRLPLWFFHAADDETVPVTVSDTNVESLRALGARPIYTRYAKGGHSDSVWPTAWRTPALQPWMAAQRRGAKQQEDPATVLIMSRSAEGGVEGTTMMGRPGLTDPLLTKVEWASGSYHPSTRHEPTIGSVEAWKTGAPADPASKLIEIIAVGTSWSTGLGGETYYSATLNANGSGGDEKAVSASETQNPESKRESENTGISSQWKDADIGSPDVSGRSFQETKGFIVIRGAGTERDQWHFVYQAMRGDGAIVARAAHLDAAGTIPVLAGLMIRERVETKAPFVFMGAQYSAQSYWATSDWAEAAGPAVADFSWFKIKREGDVLTGSLSLDGITWTEVGKRTVAMKAEVVVGLAVRSAKAGVLSSNAFDQVSVTSGKD